MPGPATPQPPDVSQALNSDLTRVEPPVAEQYTSLQSWNTHVPEILSRMETLVNAVDGIGVKIQEWEDECAADGEEGPEDPNPRQSTTPDPHSFNPTQALKAEPGASLTFFIGEGIHFSHCSYGDTTPTPGVDTQFSGVGDILRLHTQLRTPKPAASCITLPYEGGGATFDLPGLDMNSTTHDGERHVRFSNMQQFFKNDPLSAMCILPSSGGTGMAPIWSTPDLRSYSVPESFKPGTAPTHKDPKVPVRALFGTDKFALETLDPETRQVIKDLLKRLVFSGDWVTFEPLGNRYTGFWCKDMAPDLLAYAFYAFFQDEGNLHASLLRFAGWTYEHIYNLDSTIGQGRVSGELLATQWVAMNLPRQKAVANYSLWIIQGVLHARRTASKLAFTLQRAKQVWRLSVMGATRQNLPSWQS